MSGSRHATCGWCGRSRQANHSRPPVAQCRDCKDSAREPIDHWTEAAACAGLDTDTFYALEEGQQRQAKAVCKSCPVIADCLTHALANNEEGIWGGTTENERRVMQGKRAKYQERGERSTRKAPTRDDAGPRITVRKDGDWWSVTHRAQEAKAASWDAAIDFANRIASTN